MSSKAWWQSKTIWFNVLTALLIIATRHGFSEFTPDPNIEFYAQIVETVVVAVGNIILRLVTRQPVQ